MEHRNTPEPSMTNEDMIKDYPRLKLEYTRLHEDYRRLAHKSENQVTTEIDINRMKNQKFYQKQREAILNDIHRKELLKSLFDLYANSIPIALKKDDGTVVCSYSDEIEELAEKIREQIRLRDNQVFDAYS